MFYAMNVRKRFPRSQNEAARISTSQSRIIIPFNVNFKDVRLAESQSAQQTSSKYTKQLKNLQFLPNSRAPAIIKNRNKEGEHKSVWTIFVIKNKMKQE